MLTIMVVDDSNIIRNRIARGSESMRFDVVATAANGKDAVQLYDVLRPDIVTMDLTMPEMNGLACIRNIISLALLWSAVSLAAVNINTATAEELKALPGIGPSKAAAIVEYRQHNGQFKSVDDLKNVKGIGEGILAKLRDEATVSGGKKPVKAAVPALKEKAKEKR